MRLSDLKKISQIQLLYIIATVNALALIVVYGVMESPDSGSYFDAWNVSYAHGVISNSRPPVYPVLLGMTRTLFGKTLGAWFVVLIQFCLFFYSIHCFRKVCSVLFQSNKMVFYLTLFYAIYPCFTNWNLYLLTESLALSLSVILIYCLMRIWKDGSKVNLISTTLCLFLMLFLRPSFIYIVPIILVAYLLLFIIDKSRRVVAMLGVILTFVPIGLMLSYMSSFEKKYGLYATSNVSVVNQYYIARQYGILDPSDIKEESLREYIEKDISQNGKKVDSRTFLWENTGRIFEEFDDVQIDKAVKKSIYNNPKAWLQGLVERCYYAVRHPLFKSPIDSWGYILNLLGPSINTLVFLLIVYTVIILYGFIRKQKMPWLSFVIYMMVCSNLIVIIVGAQDEYSRLLLPSLPIAVIMFGQIWDFIKKRQFVLR